jgi:prolyl oligopeptidase family protein
MRSILLFFFAVMVIASSGQAQIPKPPPSRVDNVREVIHGVEIIDPYRWLEDQDAPENTCLDRRAKQIHSFAARRACIATCDTKAIVGIAARRFDGHAC